jgi:hypothetical protein
MPLTLGGYFKFVLFSAKPKDEDLTKTEPVYETFPIKNTSLRSGL